MDQKINEIREFFRAHANQANVEKYSRYFKEGEYDGYGIDTKIYEHQRDLWIEKWSAEMSLDDFLTLGDRLIPGGKYEEVSLAIALVAAQKADFSKSVFDRIGHWFTLGITNWANTDVLCMLVLPSFFTRGILQLTDLKAWITAESEWQRRSVPVTLIELVKSGLKPAEAFSLIEPLMTDASEYVQKGLGTLLRSLWKKNPQEVEAFLFKWKDRCGRLIIQYATEKMDKEYRKQFRRTK